ncbi:MAG: RecA protein [Parcubacteria group bacterium GW2011_GWC2_48_17]|nr:MAG: RecA protein [Parcubacteria group bacterium GW2011_GWC2_48_17]
MAFGKPKKEKVAKTLGANIEDTLNAIKTKFGDDAIMKLGEKPRVDINAISTGSIGLDSALGVGGLPRGRIIEVFGPESSGKTTLTLHVIAEAQKKGGICAFIDAEHAMDPEYSKKIGVKIDELLISQPDTGEQALEIVESLVRSGRIDVIVIDSVAALTPKDEIEGDMGQQHVGKQARLMSQALRKLTAIVARSKTIVIFINQIRMQIGVMFGCFSYDTKILLADGTKENIGKLVNQTKKVRVLSYNFEKKCVEPQLITDWHINGETDYFLQFFIQNHTSNGRRGFSCTGDHKIHTPKGWKKAKELKVGDEISVHITDTSLTPQQEEVIMGSLLGDGNIKKFNEQTAYFREEHGPKQSAYVSWLAAELGDITSNMVTENARGNAIVETKHLLRIGDLHGLFYPKQKKIVPEFLVEQITPRMVALWYCGDGSLQTGTSPWKGKVYERRPRATLYTNAFGDQPESRDRINRIFARFNIQPKWRKCGDYQVLNFSVAESKKFFELIAPFVPTPMEYKLPKEYRSRYHQSEPQQSRQSQLLRPMRIKEVRPRVPYQNGQRISKQRFDISVANNHNYFADGSLVSNSPETTPGGKALKFYTSVRLDIRRIAQIKKGDEVMGGRVRVKVVKNKVAAPFKQTEFDLMYNEGISREGELIALGEKMGLVKKSGTSYEYDGVKLGRGYDATRQFLRENKKVSGEILRAIVKQLKDGALTVAETSESEASKETE